MAGKRFLSVMCKAAAKTVRNDRMSDRDYLVVPMVMLTEGVHAGSEGPYYYPPNEIAKRVTLWNAKPVVVYHPSEPSACTPEILSTRQIGVIMNTKWDGKNNRLTAEAWLEKDRINKVDERIMEAIDNEETLELSTGLMADSDEEAGEWNGEKFNGTLSNFGPDHLAVLPDQKGACSVEDGAGFIRNAAESGYRVLEVHAVDGTSAQYVQVDSDAFGKASAFFKKHPKNETSQNSVREQLQKIIGEGSAKDEWRYVEDVFDTYFIWSGKAGLYKQEFEVDKDVVKVKGLPVQVVRKFVYETVKNEKPITNEKDIPMDIKQLVDALITNKSFEESDREMLSGLKQGVLEKLLTNAKPPEAPKPEPVVPQNQMTPSQPQTMEQYLANAPEGIRNTLMNAMEAESAEKDRLIETIKKNPQNTFDPAWLKTQDIKFLRNLSNLAKIAVKTEDADPRFTHNYGVSEPVVDTSTLPVLELPKMDFSKK